MKRIIRINMFEKENKITTLISVSKKDKMKEFLKENTHIFVVVKRTQKKTKKKNISNLNSTEKKHGTFGYGH